ncbi:phosphatidylinositol 5-phosphate 4-kinase type-2 alpha-like [Sycon ciliatum]|uniref:phosphatidylinositol 5-phosphate 4-kinase type-2 alpha-like n=1 Tax=Sycon ciliatum TaxID=27933 RepID=UPI0031F61863
MAPGGNKKKKKAGKSHFVHQKKRVFRASEPLLSVFMWGINHSTAALNHVNIPAVLLPDDFRACSKIKVENHLFNEDIFPGKFKFKSYCPLVFHDLRKRFGVSETTFMNSLTQLEPRPMDNGGASDYVSHDGRFVIKTVQGDEVVALFHHIIMQYHQYVVESEGNTLLPQYLGMYRLTVGTAESYILVMRNIFSSTLPIHRKYDLKGCAYSRSASSKERAKDLPTLKDSDFLLDGAKLQVGAKNKEAILKLLEADTDFLASLKLMDYSLLVGIHDADCRQRQAVFQYRDEDDEEASGTGTGDESAQEDCSADEAAALAGEMSALSVLRRVLREPRPIVVADSAEARRATSSDHYPVVRRDIDHYAFAACDGVHDSRSPVPGTLTEEEDDTFVVDKPDTQLTVSGAVNNTASAPNQRTSPIASDKDDGLLEASERSRPATAPSQSHRTGARQPLKATLSAPRDYGSSSDSRSSHHSPNITYSRPHSRRCSADEILAGLLSTGSSSSSNPCKERISIDLSSSNKVYYLGLIDVLAHYGPRKMAAHTAKTVKLRADEVMPANPKAYAQHFLQFFEKHLA